MTEYKTTNRFITCIGCGRMMLVSDVRPITYNDEFWGKNTYHITTKNEAVQDIGREVQGREFEPYLGRTTFPMAPGRQRMIEVLKAPLAYNLKAQYQRRTDTINTLIDYCEVEEESP